MSPIVFQDAYAVVTSDTVEQRFAALYIGVAGDVTIETLGNKVVVFKAVAVGMLYVSGVKVKAATAATNIVALV